LEFHSPFGLKYSLYKNKRFQIRLPKPESIKLHYEYSSSKPSYAKFSHLLDRGYDEYNLKYSFKLDGLSLYETVRLGSKTFTIYTKVSDEEKKKFISLIFSLYGVKQYGKVPILNSKNSRNFLLTMLSDEDSKRKKILGFDFMKRKVYLKKNEQVSLRLTLSPDGHYFLCDNRKDHKREREALAENIHTFIQKQKVRMLTGVI